MGAHGVGTFGDGRLARMAGFAAFTVAPALGLPPELPGMMAADLGPRQARWAERCRPN